MQLILLKFSIDTFYWSVSYLALITVNFHFTTITYIQYKSQKIRNIGKTKQTHDKPSAFYFVNLNYMISIIISLDRPATQERVQVLNNSVHFQISVFVG